MNPAWRGEAFRRRRQPLKAEPVEFFLAKMVFLRILITGCARRGASGALFPKSAYAGLNSRPRILYLEPLNHFDWTPRNRRSWTSSGPEGSSDKWCGLCRGLISICIMWRGFLKGSTAGAQPLPIWDFWFRIADFGFFRFGIWDGGWRILIM